MGRVAEKCSQCLHARENPPTALSSEIYVAPEAGELVLQLDAVYSGSSIDSPDQADQELTYIDTFLDSF